MMRSNSICVSRFGNWRYEICGDRETFFGIMYSHPFVMRFLMRFCLSSRHPVYHKTSFTSMDCIDKKTIRALLTRKNIFKKIYSFLHPSHVCYTDFMIVRMIGRMQRTSIPYLAERSSLALSYMAAKKKAVKKAAPRKKAAKKPAKKASKKR